MSVAATGEFRHPRDAKALDLLHRGSTMVRLMTLATVGVLATVSGCGTTQPISEPGRDVTVAAGCPVLEPDTSGLFFAMMIGDFAAAQQCPNFTVGTSVRRE